MKTKFSSAFALLAVLTLFTTSPRAPAQSLWGNALSFDGVDDYIEAGAVPLANSSFTLEAWARRHSANSMDAILGQGGGGTSHSLYFGCFNSQFLFGFYDDDLWTTNSYTDTDWHHWAGTYDAATKARCLYRDGVLVAADTASANYQGSGPLIIGSVPWTPNAQFDGQLDDVRVWNVARSQAEVAAHMSFPLTGTESSLLACWKFDETSGTTAQDATTNGYNGTLFNGPQWTPSTIPLQSWGNALSFNGANSYVLFTRPVSNDFTLECWLCTTQRFSTTLGGGTNWYNGAGLIDADVPNVANDFGLSLRNGYACFGTAGDPSINNAVSLADGQWHHVAATRSTSGALSLYVDGYWMASGTGTNNPLTASDQINIGRIRTVPNFFQGRIDEVRIWNVVRTPAQIHEGLCHPLSGTEPNLVAYYRFDEGAGTIAYDATTNHLDGTLFNGPVWTNSTIPAFINVAPTVAPGLPGVLSSSVAWGDYDNDGRLDFLLTGTTNSGSPGAIAQLWRNTGSGFTNVTATVAPGLPGASFSSVAWGDYDNDGRLDFLLTGYLNSGPIAQVWRNTGSGFVNVTATVAPGLPGVSGSSVAWGDYDSDGRLDFLLTGSTNAGVIAQVWRNTGSGFVNVTATVAAGLPGVYNSSVAWGDYDNDGRLDFLLTGTTNATSSGGTAQVWRNTGSGFINVTATVAPGLPGVEFGSVAWGDYDNDGRLDFLLTGLTGSGFLISQVWRNTGSGFTNVTATVAPGLPGVYGSSVAWGDYDNDGRLDFLLTGYPSGSVRISQVWRNTGSGFVNVTATVAPGLPGVFVSSVAWGDYDNDGRLDFLLTGYYWDGSDHSISQVWRNIGWTANTLPVPPAGLAVAGDGSAVSLSWNPGSDPETPASGLTYNLRVGSTPGGSDILSPSASGDGARRLPALGNAQQVLRVPLTSSRTGRIYWSVQAVDAAFAGGPFAPEQSFNLWPVLGPDSGLVPGDANGDSMVDAADLAILLTRLNGNGTVSQGDLNLVLSNYWPSSPWLSMTNVAGLGGTNVTFALSNSTAGAYSVLMSTNLEQWEYLGPATPRYEFSDTNAPAEPQRYYRLRWP